MATTGLGKAQHGMCGIAHDLHNKPLHHKIMSLYSIISFGVSATARDNTYIDFFFSGGSGTTGPTSRRRIRTWLRNQN